MSTTGNNKRELANFLSIQLGMIKPKEGCELIVSDVLLLLISFQVIFHNHKIWLKSGTASKQTFVCVHDVKLTDDVPHNLLIFLVLTRYDTTLQISGNGKIIT